MRLLLSLFCLMFAAITSADTLYITEFKGAPPLSVYFQAATTPAVASQTVSISGTSAQSAAFNSSTGLIRVSSDVACFVVIGGTSPTATTSSMRLAAGQAEYFLVTAGHKLAVIE